MAAPSESSSPSDGPVLSLLSKRLRGFRKKYNRVLQMEENVAKGKVLNREQEDVLRSKPQLLSLIEEYERLRAPLAAAVQEELSLSASTPPSPTPSEVVDILRLLYFARLFDVRPHADYETTMLMRAHERGCCITYDTVTDETTSLLEERHLDAIATLGAFMLSRSPDSHASHRAALEDCVHHALQWVHASPDPIRPGSPFTYAGLRELLDRIWGSNYSTATPEIKPSMDLAAEVGKYAGTGQVQGEEGEGEGEDEEKENGALEAEQAEYEPKTNDLEDLENKETGTNTSSQTDEPAEHNVSDAQDSYKDTPDQLEHQPEHDNLQAEDTDEPNYREGENEQQQYIPRRMYPNQRARGGRRPYGNGRMGRGGRGGRGYQNGRGQYYDPSYHPGNFYTPRGRNGRGGGSYSHAGPGYSGQSPRVELGAS